MVQVRDEIVQMLKGMLCASICPAVSVELAKHGYSQVNVEEQCLTSGHYLIIIIY